MMYLNSIRPFFLSHEFNKTFLWNSLLQLVTAMKTQMYLFIKTIKGFLLLQKSIKGLKDVDRGNQIVDVTPRTFVETP